MEKTLARLTTNSDVSFLYIAALVPALIAALALAMVAARVIWLFPHWLTKVIGFGLSAGGSFIIYWLVARRMLSHIARASHGGVVGHIVRSASMYICLSTSVALVAANWTNPDFVLIWVVFVWSGAASLGGILADAAAGLRMARR